MLRGATLYSSWVKQGNSSNKLLSTIKISFFLLSSLSSCTTSDIQNYPHRMAEIFYTPQSYKPKSTPENWAFKGSISDDEIKLFRGVLGPTLHISSGSSPYIFGRKISERLLISPYLTWRWKLKAGEWINHPIKIFIGIDSGAINLSKRSSILNFFANDTLPKYDRGIFIVWNKHHSKEGKLVHIGESEEEMKKVEYFIQRGKEDVGKWRTETVDIAALYKRSWPKESDEGAKIVIIGIASSASSTYSSGLIKSLALSH